MSVTSLGLEGLFWQVYKLFSLTVFQLSHVKSNIFKLFSSSMLDGRILFSLHYPVFINFYIPFFSQISLSVLLGLFQLYLLHNPIAFQCHYRNSVLSLFWRKVKFSAVLVIKTESLLHQVLCLLTHLKFYLNSLQAPCPNNLKNCIYLHYLTNYLPIFLFVFESFWEHSKNDRVKFTYNL